MFLHNNQYHILYERATKDLQQFLDDEESDRYFSSPRQIILLLSEFSVLSSALAFLHDKVEHSNTRYICCHMDLKPDNIFVFTDTNDHIKFKIADLGISKLRSRPLERDRPGFRKSHNVYEDEIRYLPTTMNTSASRGPGTFQAPEMYKHEKVGRASDVWSLGCLLMVFVIRMFGGVDGYQEFENARHVRERYSNDYFHFDGKVKPEVTERLDKLPESYENKLERLGKDCEKSVFEDLKQLIKMCLKEDAKSRIKSADFHRKLKEIVKYMKQALWKTRLDVLKGGKSLNFSNDVEATSKIRFSSERINTLGLSTYRACFDDLVKMEIIEGQNAARIRCE
jgi:serine/threonine protein kinase